MHLYIDTRAGSNKLLDYFDGECRPSLLESGDVAFFGVGPGNTDWYIGIEYKTLDDFCASMKSGRFTGTQLPAMLRIYDVCFVIIEGIGFLDRNTGSLVKKMGKMSYSMGIPYSGYQNFLTAVSVHSALSGKPCIVKRTIGVEETVSTIKATYAWFQKPWEQHTGISRPDQTKIQRIAYDLETIRIQPGSSAYPKYLLRQAVFQIRGVGWDLAGRIADRFGTMETLMHSGQRDLEALDKLGKILAARIYNALHGYPDPALQIRARKKRDPLIPKSTQNSHSAG